MLVDHLGHVESLPFAQLSEALFADDWAAGCPLQDVWQPLGAASAEAQPWLRRGPTADGRRGARRLLVTLLWECGPLSLATKLEIDYEMEEVLNYEGQRAAAIVINATIRNSGFPYADYFILKERVFFVERDGGISVSRGLDIVMVKQTIFRTALSWHVKEGKKKADEVLLSILRTYHRNAEVLVPYLREVEEVQEAECDADATSPSEKCEHTFEIKFVDRMSSQETADEDVLNLNESDVGNFVSNKIIAVQGSEGKHITPDSSIIVEVWELQRRSSPFHHDWQSPFMLHDGMKGLRWVDLRYKRHPWMFVSRSVAASSSTPPLEPPPGLTSKGVGWTVVDLSGSAVVDNDGWQYGLDFFKSSLGWGHAAVLCTCRRRLWRCTFAPAVVPSLTPRTVTIQIWELQRRATIFQADWHSPSFLHDMGLRQRWVDFDFDAHHPWTVGSLEPRAASDSPPIQAPAGWTGHGWSVAVPSGPCDEAGWQYCFDFNLEQHYSSSPSGKHCRRRLWTCTYTADDLCSR